MIQSNYMIPLFQLVKMYVRKPKKIITHNGSFHADDVMACALLQTYYASAGYRTTIVRTRNPELFKTGDVVFDVGGIYDVETNRFDHHQPGGAGNRDNGIPYSSVGLVWKKFGPSICAPYMQLVDKIDTDIIQSIDAKDNGYDIPNNDTENLLPFFSSSFYMVENTTWKENLCGDDHDDLKRFKRAVKKAKDFFNRYLLILQTNLEATEKIKKTYQDTTDKRVLIFDQNFTRTVFIANLVNFPEPLFHIYPDRSGTWSIETIPKDFGSFERRIDFPESWAGLHDEPLQLVSGISDLLFCHNGRFLCKTKTLVGAELVAKKILESK